MSPEKLKSELSIPTVKARIITHSFVGLGGKVQYTLEWLHVSHQTQNTPCFKQFLLNTVISTDVKALVLWLQSNSNAVIKSKGGY